MILISSITEIVDYVESNRIDVGSDTPYMTIGGTSGAWLIPDNYLVRKGLKELNIAHSVVVYIRGVKIVVESVDFIE